MLNWIIGILFTGHVHKWKMDSSVSGTYRDTNQPYVINKMKCEKCGMFKLVEKTV